MRLTPDIAALSASALVLLGSAGWSFFGARLPAPPVAAAPAPQGADWAPVAPPEFGTEATDWTPPQAQSADGLWLYDVFTPPKIYIDPETNRFSVVPYVAPAEKEPFGIVLLAVERPLYRIQYEGYIEEDPADVKKSLLRLFDRVNRASILIRVGQENQEAGIRVEDFSVEKNLTEGGVIDRVERVRLTDRRTGEAVELTSRAPRFDSGVVLRFGLEAGGTAAFAAEKAGDTFRAGQAEYRVVEINAEAGTVRVEKRVDGTETRETAVLRVRNETAARMPGAGRSEADRAGAQGLKAFSLAHGMTPSKRMTHA